MLSKKDVAEKDPWLLCCNIFCDIATAPTTTPHQWWIKAGGLNDDLSQKDEIVWCPSLSHRSTYILTETFLITLVRGIFSLMITCSMVWRCSQPSQPTHTFFFLQKKNTFHVQSLISFGVYFLYTCYMQMRNSVELNWLSHYTACKEDVMQLFVLVTVLYTNRIYRMNIYEYINIYIWRVIR